MSEFWNEVEKYCFSNVDGWKEIYITEAVITYEDNGTKNINKKVIYEFKPTGEGYASYYLHKVTVE